MAEVPGLDDGQGAQLIWRDLSALATGRIWPWVLTAVAVLIIVVGAVSFSPHVFG